MMSQIFRWGSCYKLAKIMRTIWPELEAWNSLDHVWVKIGGRYYDIEGEHTKLPGFLVKVDMDHAGFVDHSNELPLVKRHSSHGDPPE